MRIPKVYIEALRIAVLSVALSSCNVLVSPSEQKTDASFHPGFPRGSGSSSSDGSTTAPDLTDDDDTSTGFAGGAKVGVQWNTDKLVLGPDTDCDGNMSEGETTYTNCAELDESWTPQWSSLVSYWKMNESSWNATANEVQDSKNSNHGTGHNGATTTVTSKIGSHAATFDGINDFVQVSDAVNINPTTAITVSAWIYTADPTGNYKMIVTKGSDSQWELRHYSNSGQIEFMLKTGGAWGSYARTSVISANSWQHVVGTYDGSNVKIYLNGVFQEQRPFTGAIATTATDFFIGKRSDGFNYDGKIDEVVVWNTALEYSEIKTIYSRQAAKYSGSHTSRVMNYGSSNSWDGLKWLTTLPFGKELTGDADNSDTITTSDSESSSDYSALVGSTGSIGDDNLMNGIVGLWHLNEATGTTGASSVIDGSAGSNDGTPTDVTFGGLGKLDKSAFFNGSSSYISLPYTPFSGATKFSFAYWINPQRLPSGGDYYAIMSNWFDGSQGLVLGYINSTGTLQFAISPGTWFSIAGGSISANQWQHAAGTWDGTNMLLYLNGIQVASGTTTAQTFPACPGCTVRLGSGQGGGAYFPGSIDEVAIWDRALHADEVKQLYRRGANRIKYQVRTCSSSDCSDNPTWLGNDNTNESYFSELHNYAPYSFDTNNCSASNLILTRSPSLLFDCFTGALSNLTNRQYFQYRTILESDDTSTNCEYGSGATWCSPELKSVEVKP